MRVRIVKQGTGICQAACLVLRPVRNQPVPPFLSGQEHVQTRSNRGYLSLTSLLEMTARMFFETADRRIEQLRNEVRSVTSISVPSHHARQKPIEPLWFQSTKQGAGDVKASDVHHASTSLEKLLPQPYGGHVTPCSLPDPTTHRPASKPLRCFNCQQEGHFARNCPKPKTPRSRARRPIKVVASGAKQTDTDQNPSRAWACARPSTLDGPKPLNEHITAVLERMVNVSGV